MARRITKAALAKKLKALGKVSDEQKREIACSLIGHSKIQTLCFGYYNCARCGAQLGDNLGSTYPAAETAVIVGHNCVTCEANYKACDWRDKFMAPDPFEKATA